MLFPLALACLTLPYFISTSDNFGLKIISQYDPYRCSCHNDQKTWPLCCMPKVRTSSIAICWWPLSAQLTVPGCQRHIGWMCSVVRRANKEPALQFHGLGLYLSPLYNIRFGNGNSVLLFDLHVDLLATLDVSCLVGTALAGSFRHSRSTFGSCGMSQ